MLDDKEKETLLTNEELIKETKSLKRQLRNLESTIQRNKAMLAARTTVNSMLEYEQKKMERNMNLLLENSADIILLFDENGRFTYFSNTFLKATGIAASGLIAGRHFSEVFTPLVPMEWIDHIQTKINLAMERRSTIVVNSSLDLSGGDNPQDYDIQITPMMDQDGQLEAFMILLHDVTDIIRSKREAESASIAKSQFLATMSHEMRTPMNAVLGMTTIGKSAHDIERMIYCFGKIEDASKHLLGVINDILDMSKIEAEKFELSPTDFCFENMLQRVINILSFQTNEKSQSLSIYIDNTIPMNLVGDDQRLAQVTTNLLGNAIKFTPEGGTINLDARLLEENDGIYTIKVAVTDTGIGISPEQQADLFQSFHQAESNTTRKYGGTGLGLVISKTIVEMMGGEIQIESEPGKGSTFSYIVHLMEGIEDSADTVSIAIGEEEQKIEEEQNDDFVSFAGNRILLADDVEINREIMLALLEPLFLEIGCAENGAEAVRMFSEAPDDYDMVFMDIQMPEMDGYEATRRIRALDIAQAKTIPIVAMTANVFREDIIKCIESGMNDHIGKPLYFDEVLRQLRLYLPYKSLVDG